MFLQKVLSQSPLSHLPFIFLMNAILLSVPYPTKNDLSKVINDPLISQSNNCFSDFVLLNCSMVMDTIVHPYSLKLFIPLALSLALLLPILSLASSFSVSFMGSSSSSCILNLVLHGVLIVVPFLSQTLKPLHRTSNSHL